MSEEYDLLVTDFGLATLLDPAAASHTCLTPCGTRSYKPPEVRAAEGKARDGAHAYDPEKYDVWSACVVVFIMKAGFGPLRVSAPGRVALLSLWLLPLRLLSLCLCETA